MQVILLLVIVIILLYNLIVNLNNMTIIVKYCLGTNTIDEYWSMYFKHCFSFRAIYSSIFGLIIAIIVFFVLIPVVIIRKIIFKGKINQYVSDGLIFTYNDVELASAITFFSNCNDYGFAINRVEATGKISDDIENVLNELLLFAKNNDKELHFDFMKEMYIMSSDKTAVAPIMLIDGERNFPVYFLYDDKQINQYKNIKQTLLDTRFKECIYFSIKNF